MIICNVHICCVFSNIANCGCFFRTRGCFQSNCPCLQHLAGLEWGRPDLPRWQPLALIASPHWPPPPPPPQLGISLDISLSGQGHPAPLRARPAPRCSADRPGPPSVTLGETAAPASAPIRRYQTIPAIHSWMSAAGQAGGS